MCCGVLSDNWWPDLLDLTAVCHVQPWSDINMREKIDDSTIDQRRMVMGMLMFLSQQ